MNAGIIGTGTIGSRVAQVLRDSGVDVFVWSPTPRPIPNFLGSAAEVAAATKTVQLFVSDGAAVMEVVEAMRPQLTHEHVVINSATVDPSATERAAAIVGGCAASFLDCPFTGSRDAAAAGELVYYVGGNRDVLERARPHLDPAARQILHVGEIGHATVLKLAANLVAASTAAALAEALAIVRAEGLSGEKLARALELSAVGSPLIASKLQALVDRDFTPHFSLGNMLKDARYAAELASGHGLELPVHAHTLAQFERSAGAGASGLDFSAVNHDVLGTGARGTSPDPDRGQDPDRVPDSN